MEDLTTTTPWVVTETTTPGPLDGNNHQHEVSIFDGAVPEPSPALTQTDLENATGEAGDAELLAKLCRDRMIFDRAVGKWFVFENVCWKEDRNGTVRRHLMDGLYSQYLAAVASLQLAASAATAPIIWQQYEEQAATLLRKGANLRKLAYIKAVLELTADQPGMSTPGDTWDRDPWLLCVANGTLDLRTGELREGNPQDYTRRSAPTRWEGLDAQCPRWEQFLQEVFPGDDDLIAYLQRLLGYAITGVTDEHVLPVLWGFGRNGKTVLIETLAAVLGSDLTVALPADAVMDTGRAGDGPQPHLFNLRGKRLAWASESNEGRVLNAGLVKQLTGGDTLTVRTLYTEPVAFKPTHKIFLITNHKPNVPANDDAVWDRIALIPFAQRFVDDPRHPIDHQRDPKLAEKLADEAPGILAWLVRGCLEWQHMGLQPPDAVKAETGEWRDKADHLTDFLEHCCTVDSGLITEAKTLQSEYQNWAEKHSASPLTSQNFSGEMQRRFRRRHTRTGWLNEGLAVKE
jgi:putative DNA primase/helicase